MALSVTPLVILQVKKLAFIGFFCNRIHICPLEEEEKEKETHNKTDCGK
jgi:hypothetical protein